MLGKNRGSIQIIVLSLILLILPGVVRTYAQTSAPRKAEAPPAAAPAVSPTNEVELASVQEQLFKLLRISPKLTSVLAYDPSLLGYPDYVNNNNPELGRFLESHPEIMRNPEFYLFSRLPGGGRGSIPGLFQRAVWPEIGGREPSRLAESVVPFLVFLVVVAAILWLLRIFLHNRRWGRLFKAQTDIHTKLLDKLGGSQELFTYLGTEAGRKFMELAPISVATEPPQHPGLLSPFSRILALFQVGTVLAMVGIGILYVRTPLHDSGPLLLIGTMGIMLGIGLILSAGLSWMLARRFGLIQQSKQEDSDSKLSLN